MSAAIAITRMSAALLLAGAGGGAPRQGAQRTAAGAPQTSARATHNPRRLSAVQLLEPTRPGLAPHVRFEWDQVPDARGYLLYGRWANADSWTIQNREFHVTARAATEWDSSRVVFDAALPEGSHSWNLVALFGPDGTGDFQSPTLLSFELR